MADDVTEARIENSPSGRYRLTISSISNELGWSHTLGVVARGTGEEIERVERNFSAFPFLWVEGHPNGHDYLVCGADYQGQTVIELDSGQRRDHLPPEAEKGHAFCWGAYELETGRMILVVEGCYWACPWEIRFYDFVDPMGGWPEIVIDGEYVPADGQRPAFHADGTITCYELRDDDPCDATIPSSQRTRSVVASRTFRRDGLRLAQVSEWIDVAELKRRRDAETAERERKEAWERYKTSDPVYLFVEERIARDFADAERSASVGSTFAGWCPHFEGRDGRICRRLVNRRVVRERAITIDLEWGRDVAPINLVVYVDGTTTNVLWFDRSLDGMRAALDAALAQLA